MKYQIGPFKANSKRALQDHANEILYSDNVGSILAGDDLTYMLTYFARFHCEWELKKGIGIKFIKRVDEPMYGKHRAFWIERIDGTSTDISYILPNIQKKDYFREFSQAMRKVIEPQILAFRDKVFENAIQITCPITGQKVSLTEAHVDHHVPTFKEMIKDFIIEYGIKLSSELFPPEKDGQIRYDITDEVIKGEFYAYHEQRANLRILSQAGNLRRKKS